MSDGVAHASDHYIAQVSDDNAAMAAAADAAATATDLPSSFSRGAGGILNIALRALTQALSPSPDTLSSPDAALSGRPLFPPQPPPPLRARPPPLQVYSVFGWAVGG